MERARVLIIKNHKNRLFMFLEGLSVYFTVSACLFLVPDHNFIYFFKVLILLSGGVLLEFGQIK